MTIEIWRLCLKLDGQKDLKSTVGENDVEEHEQLKQSVSSDLEIRQECFSWSINRLNPRIFELSEWNLNMDSSDFRASKIISNDTKLEPISSETII